MQLATVDSIESQAILLHETVQKTKHDSPPSSTSSALLLLAMLQSTLTLVQQQARFSIIKPRRACAARVTVVVLCVWLFVCLYTI